jgi:hypothetical protein
MLLIRFVVVWQIDKNGKRNQWEGVVLIPFIDDDKLLTAISAHCPDSALSDMVCVLPQVEFSFFHAELVFCVMCDQERDRNAHREPVEFTAPHANSNSSHRVRYMTVIEATKLAGMTADQCGVFKFIAGSYCWLVALALVVLDGLECITGDIFVKAGDRSINVGLQFFKKLQTGEMAYGSKFVVPCGQKFLFSAEGSRVCDLSLICDVKI